MKYYTLLFFVILLNKFSATSQTSPSHHDHDHQHLRGEIGFALSPVYFFNAKEIGTNLHIHYVHNIPHTKFGVGLGAEQIFSHHTHTTFGIVGSYRPIEPLSFNISPGLLFENGDFSHSEFALHFETSYEFILGPFHVGPLMELAYDPEDYHLSLGFHLGYAF